MKKTLLFIGLSFTVLHADILVVMSEKSSSKQLSKQDIERIFLNKTRFLPGGERVEVIEGISSELKDSFYHEVTRKSTSQLRSYWAKLIFTGKGKPPRQIKKDNLVNYLNENPNAITYISEAQMNDSLKVLYKIQR